MSAFRPTRSPLAGASIPVVPLPEVLDSMSPDGDGNPSIQDRTPASVALSRAAEGPACRFPLLTQARSRAASGRPAVCLGILLGLLSCDATPADWLRRLGDGSPDPIGLVPLTSVLAASLDWPRVRANLTLRQIFAPGDEPSFRSLSLEEQAVTNLVIFTDGRTRTKPGIGLIVVLRPDAPVPTLPVGDFLARSSYLDRAIFCDGRLTESCASVLEDRMLVVGSRPAVEGVLDVVAGTQPGFMSGSVAQELAGKAAGRAPIMALLVPTPGLEEALAASWQIASAALSLSGLGPLQELFSRLGAARGLRLAIDGREPLVTVETAALMTTEQSALLTAGMIRLLKAATSALPAEELSPQDREALLAFQSIVVTRTGPILTVRLSLPGSAFSQ